MKRWIIYILFLTSCFQISLVAQNHQFANQLRLAKTYEARGNFEAAEEIYKKLYDAQPGNYEFYNSLNQILISQKKYDEALALIKRQISLSKNQVVLLGDLGSVYYLLGNESKARTIWEEALEIEPVNPFAYRTIANYLIENRLLDYAIEVLKRGNEVSDDKTIFSYDIANFYSITMKYEEATREYCSILLQKPKQINLIKNRINAYINSNQATDVTLQTVEEFYSDEENIVFLELLAELYSTTENYEKALEAVIEIEQLTTSNGSSIFAFAQKSERQSNYDLAAKAYKFIIDYYPSSALFAQSEIEYTKNLEYSLSEKASFEQEWKPLTIESISDSADYIILLNNYQNLAFKYSNNIIGLEAEYRIAIIYQDYLKDPIKADSCFKKILDESKSLQFIEDVKFRLAQLFIQSNDLDNAEDLLSQVKSSARTNSKLKEKTNFQLAKISMWKGEFTNSINRLKEVTSDPSGEFVNDALQYSLILNTFKSDSINLFSFVNADYLVEKNKYVEALNEYKYLSENKNLFILKDFASIRYAELLIALNNYKEATIFLEEISCCDENNIYADRFLYLLGSVYYFGLNDASKAEFSLNRIFNEYQNSIYYNKAVKIISRINERVGNTL